VTACSHAFGSHPMWLGLWLWCSGVDETTPVVTTVCSCYLRENENETCDAHVLVCCWYSVQFIDPYIKTKIIAENDVLAANGTDTAHSGKKLLTVSLRPSGIFGPRDVQV